MRYGQTLKRGAKGSAVKSMQQDLIKLSYSLAPYGADGSFGAVTEKAVNSFQKANGLAVDGSVGPATQAKIDQLIKVPAPSKDYKKLYEDLLAKVNQAKKILG